jgi:cell wall assembly regulator SMI1
MERTEITKHGVTLTLNKPLADEARVGAFEAKLGRRLPDDYREFLLHYNGGKPKPSSFQLALRTEPNTDSLVHWFLSLHDGEHSNLERNIKIMTGRLPSDTLPIADDPFGNVVLLGLHGEIRGKVYFWDHEREPDDEPDWSNIDLVAESFDSFMSGLKPAR